VRGQCAGYGD